MKVVCGLGNPGAEYEATRHNVGWWVVDALREAWALPGFRRAGPARSSAGSLRNEPVLLLEPLTYMNRSGVVLAPLTDLEGFDPGRDLLVVVDDVNLELARPRLRARGSHGGHNGLRSIEAELDTREYARLRIGVGPPPPGVDLIDWVLSPFPPGDAAVVRERIPDYLACITTWAEAGAEAAMQTCNR